MFSSSIPREQVAHQSTQHIIYSWDCGSFGRDEFLPHSIVLTGHGGGKERSRYLEFEIAHHHFLRVATFSITTSLPHNSSQVSRCKYDVTRAKWYWNKTVSVLEKVVLRLHFTSTYRFHHYPFTPHKLIFQVVKRCDSSVSLGAEACCKSLVPVKLEIRWIALILHGRTKRPC